MPIDFSIPREMIPWEGDGDPGPCPKCGAPLKQERASYLVLTRRGNRETDSFVTGTDKGWFCTQCPVLLLNPQEVAGLLSFGKIRKWDIGNQFVVVGIVDLDAIPPEKQNMPSGAPGNPLPLVEFSNLKTSRSSRQRRSGRRRSSARSRRKKHRR